eukprot:gb/GECG01007120.1/.p1 GENE.gb/GECG01007120.1/~~gb/GECG01007120.1/.p1  ORF type:complete len:1094 (+),score=138.72 gb/GECG01007120.1/:1-3282(+)
MEETYTSYADPTRTNKTTSRKGQDAVSGKTMDEQCRDESQQNESPQKQSEERDPPSSVSKTPMKQQKGSEERAGAASFQSPSGSPPPGTAATPLQPQEDAEGAPKMYSPKPVPPRYKPLVRACQSGDLSRLKGLWKPQMTMELLRMAPDETCHPLLHAVHHLQPSVVEFLCEAGLSPCQRGTVHPYTGDGLVVGELQGVTPIQLIDTMLWHMTAEGRRRSKKKLAGIKIQEILNNTAAQQEEREEALRGSLGLASPPTTQPSIAAADSSSNPTSQQVDSDTLTYTVTPAKEGPSAQASHSAPPKVNGKGVSESPVASSLGSSLETTAESSAQPDETSLSLPKVRVPAEDRCTNSEPPSGVQMTHKTQPRLRTANELLQYATHGEGARLPPPPRPLVAIGSKLNPGQQRSSSKLSSISCQFELQWEDQNELQERSVRKMSIPCADIVFKGNIGEKVLASPSAWIRCMWKAFEQTLGQGFDISSMQYQLYHLMDTAPAEDSGDRDAAWQNAVEWVCERAQSKPWCDFVSVRMVSTVHTSDCASESSKDSTTDLCDMLKGPAAWMPLQNVECDMSMEQQAAEVTGKVIPDKIRENLRDKWCFTESDRIPLQTGEWPFRVLLMVQQTRPTESSGVVLVVQDTKLLQRWQLQATDEHLSNSLFGVCVAGTSLDMHSDTIGKHLTERNPSELVAKHLSFQDDTDMENEPSNSLATPPKFDSSVLHPAIAVCNVLERFILSCFSQCSSGTESVWTLNLPEAVRALPEVDALKHHSLFGWPCLPSNSRSEGSVVRIGSVHALIRWLEISSVLRASTKGCSSNDNASFDAAHIEKTLSLLRQSFRFDNRTVGTWQNETEAIRDLANSVVGGLAYWVPEVMPVPVVTSMNDSHGDNDSPHWRWTWTVSQAEDAEAHQDNRPRPSASVTDTSADNDVTVPPIFEYPSTDMENAAIQAGNRMRSSFMFVVHCLRALAGAALIRSSSCSVVFACRLAQPLYDPREQELNEEDRAKVYAWCTALNSAIHNACIRDGNGRLFGASLTSLTGVLGETHLQNKFNLLRTDCVWLSRAMPCQYAVVAIELRSVKFGTMTEQQLLPLKKRRT